MKQHQITRFNPKRKTTIMGVVAQGLIESNFADISGAMNRHFASTPARIIYSNGCDQCAMKFGIHLGLDTRQVVPTTGEHISDIGGDYRHVLFIGTATEVAEFLGKFAPKSGPNAMMVSTEPPLLVREIMAMVVRPIASKVTPALIRERFVAEDGVSAKRITDSATHSHDSNQTIGTQAGATATATA